jgi:hypothetical protein
MCLVGDSKNPRKTGMSSLGGRDWYAAWLESVYKPFSLAWSCPHQRNIDAWSKTKEESLCVCPSFDKQSSSWHEHDGRKGMAWRKSPRYCVMTAVGICKKTTSSDDYRDWTWNWTRVCVSFGFNDDIQPLLMRQRSYSQLVPSLTRSSLQKLKKLFMKSQL